MNSAADLYRVQIKHLSNNLLNQGTLLPCVKYWKCISHQRYHLPTVFKGKDKVDGTDSFLQKKVRTSHSLLFDQRLMLIFTRLGLLC